MSGPRASPLHRFSAVSYTHLDVYKRQLYDLLGFAPEENPPYQAVALRIFNDYAASSENAQEEARLLAAPIRREWARDDWRGEEHA